MRCTCATFCAGDLRSSKKPQIGPRCAASGSVGATPETCVIELRPKTFSSRALGRPLPISAPAPPSK
jgi:hypothetical protein